SIKTSFSTEVEWNYGEYGPDVWDEFEKTCRGNYQSPIDIKTACTVYQSFPPFHASQANANAYPMTYTGGGLNGTLQFTSFHIHWGENYNVGSEHQINGLKYAGEIHFVHMNYEINKYDSTTTPPCTEGSSWTVFKTPIYFNNDALESFRTNLYPEKFRPVQPLDGRMVYRSFPNDTASPIPDYNCCAQNAGRSSSGVLSISLIDKQLLSFSWLFTFYILLRD
ncbi:unnamed protein product, partial [Rotaria magnacalcarata]